MTRAIGFLLAVLIWTFTTPANAAPAAVTVPFVGCASDGQIGAEPAPKGEPKDIDVTAELAKRLAFYRSNLGEGILGPRGWNCAGIVASDGLGLFLAPTPIKPADILKAYFHTVSGPYIAIWLSDGETSGRFEVAQVVARYFPKQMGVMRKIVVDENHQSMSEYPRGPYPRDRLVFRDDRVAEYITPSNAWGLGTSARMRPGPEPVRSAAILLPGDPPSSVVVSVRLPKELADLAPAIIYQAERQYAGAK